MALIHGFLNGRVISEACQEAVLEENEKEDKNRSLRSGNSYEFSLLRGKEEEKKRKKKGAKIYGPLRPPSGVRSPQSYVRRIYP